MHGPHFLCERVYLETLIFIVFFVMVATFFKADPILNGFYVDVISINIIYLKIKIRASEGEGIYPKGWGAHILHQSIWIYYPSPASCYCSRIPTTQVGSPG